jgi:hypothetical protein
MVWHLSKHVTCMGEDQAPSWKRIFHSRFWSRTVYLDHVKRVGGLAYGKLSEQRQSLSRSCNKIDLNLILQCDNWIPPAAIFFFWIISRCCRWKPHPTDCFDSFTNLHQQNVMPFRHPWWIYIDLHRFAQICAALQARRRACKAAELLYWIIYRIRISKPPVFSDPYRGIVTD